MDKALFKFFMQRNGDSVKTLAKALDMHPVTLYKKINDTAAFKVSEIKAISSRWELEGEEIKLIFFNS